MGYLADFEHDIFVSYAHADNEPDPLGVRWISEFQKFLKSTVKRHLGGREPSVFFDQIELHPSHEVASVLRKAGRSAIFVPIISTSFVARPWTNDELNAFVGASTVTGGIFPVELLPPPTGYPAPIENLVRKLFWLKEETEGAAPRTLSPKYRSELYYERLNDIAYLIANRLREMGPPEGGKKTEGTGGLLSGRTVLLAEVTDDLADERLQVRKYLESYGVNVLPKRDYPEDGTRFVEAFGADLGKADLLVQLLSEVRSVKLDVASADGERISAGRFQFDAARRAGVPLMQWLHPRAKPQAVTHFDRALIDGSLEGSQLEATMLEQFKKAIKLKLELIGKAAQPEPQADGSAPRKPYVFITAGVEDESRAAMLQDRFIASDVIASLLPTEESSAERKKKLFHDKISRADAVVFFYGETPAEFIGWWLDEYVNKEQIGRRLEAVYHAPPENKSDVPVKWRELRLFGSRKTFTLEDADKILAMLRK